MRGLFRVGLPRLLPAGVDRLIGDLTAYLRNAPATRSSR